SLSDIYTISLHDALPISIMVKIEAGKEVDVIKAVQASYKEFNPGFPFVYKFLDEDYQSLYAAEQRVAVLSRYFAGLAVLISCLRSEEHTSELQSRENLVC